MSAGKQSTDDSNVFEARTARWVPSEDQRLREAVTKLGAKHWESIGARVGSRTGRQCRDRWVHHLKPGVVKKAWTAQEDSILSNLEGLFGHQWSSIADMLPGRSSNDVKNRHHTLRRRSLNPEPQQQPIFPEPRRVPTDDFFLINGASPSWSCDASLTPDITRWGKNAALYGPLFANPGQLDAPEPQVMANLHIHGPHQPVPINSPWAQPAPHSSPWAPSSFGTAQDSVQVTPLDLQGFWSNLASLVQPAGHQAAFVREHRLDELVHDLQACAAPREAPAYTAPQRGTLVQDSLDPASFLGLALNAYGCEPQAPLLSLGTEIGSSLLADTQSLLADTQSYSLRNSTAR